MASDDFDRFMLHTKAGTHRKLRRFPDSEWRAYVGGVLGLAAESPVKGLLLIEEGEPATADDIAQHSGTALEAAESAIALAVKLKLLVPSSEYDCLEVRDWWEWNTPPRNDPTAAKRSKEYRDRKRAQRDALRDASRSGEEEITSPLINARSGSTSSFQNSKDSEPTAVDARARFDEIFADLKSRWPEERCRERDELHRRHQFETQIGVDLELAELALRQAKAQIAAHGWNDDPTGCPNLHKWLEEQRWKDRVPGKRGPGSSKMSEDDLAEYRAVMPA